MKIEELIPLYEKAMSNNDEESSAKLYDDMINIFIQESELDLELDEETLTDIIAEGISSVFSDYYLEKMVKDDMLELLIDQDGSFSYQVLNKGKVYVAKLKDIYGPDVIHYC